MSQRNTNENDEEKHELKDLFTIDELIKESKRKDDERDKESKTINKEPEDNSDIKESIIKRKESGVEDSLIEEVIDFDDSENDGDSNPSIEKMHEIADAIKSPGSDDLAPDSIASQASINEAINSATTENKEETPEISETKTITDAVINKEETPKEETTIQETLTPVEDKKETKVESINDVITKKEDKITAPPLKTPTKVEEDSVSILSGADEDYEFGASIDSSNLFEDENGELALMTPEKNMPSGAEIC